MKLTQYKVSSETMWEDIDKQFSKGGGVYILKCSKSSNSFEPMSVDRFLSCDKEGVLYIGKANCFTNRVIDLKKSISPKYKSDSHECGVRYKSNDIFLKELPFDNLYLELYGDNNPRSLEKEFLEEYQKRFGELPPFNRVG